MTQAHQGRYSRWGRNPGSLAVGGQKLPVAVPGCSDAETGKTFSPQIYHEMRQAAEPPDLRDRVVISWTPAAAIWSWLPKH